MKKRSASRRCRTWGLNQMPTGLQRRQLPAGCGHSLVWEPPDVQPQERRTQLSARMRGVVVGERRQGRRRSQPETLEGPSDIAQSPEYAGVISGGCSKLRKVRDGLSRPRKDVVFRSLS